jgi:iron complex outermembrane receptor protein
MRRLAGFVIGVLLSLGSTADLDAQAGAIRGRVSDSAGVAIARASVAVEGLGYRAFTDDQGRYHLANVPAGVWTIRVRRVGFVPATARVTVRGATVEQPFSLAPQPIGLAAIDVTVGSRAAHTAAEELAVPVDVFTAEVIERQGTREMGQILQALSPSVNFPRQSVTDATDVVRPFTLRGLSPDHTLVLLNGSRRHQTAVVNTFAYGTGAGSSGVDLNAIPAGAIDRIEVLRDGASAQYGSDAIAGVVNLVLREGQFAPFVSVDAGTHMTADYPSDGRLINANAGWGLPVGRGSLALFVELLDRQPTNRAWADPYDDSDNTTTGITDSVVNGQVVIKRVDVPQPNHHWGDGLERDLMTMGNLRLPLNDQRSRELYAFGGYSTREGNGQGYRRYRSSDRNWPAIYPLGFLPEFRPDVTDYSLAGGYRGTLGGWAFDLGAAFGHNGFVYNLRNTLNASLGPCLVTACAPGPDGIPGNGDDPNIPNQTSFMAGEMRRGELSAGFTVARQADVGLPSPLNVAAGLQLRRETFRITQGERASWIDGGDTTQSGADAPGGSQVFPGFAPSDEVDASRSNVGAYLDLETELTPRVLANVAGRFERYSDFGSLVTGKGALRIQATPRLTLRAAGSTGFRAPGLGQIHFSKVVTNVIAGQPVEIGIFPVADSAARLLGAVPLTEETAVNLSAGLAYSPDDNTTLTVDVFQINIDDRILLGATFDDDTTVAILTRGGLITPQRSIGGVQYFTNGLDTRTRGVDITGTFRWPTGPGVFELRTAVSYTTNTVTRVDPLPAILANSSEPGLLDSVTYIGITEERPDYRATLTAGYSRGLFRWLARASYFGAFSSAQPGFCDLCRERYGAKTLFDAEVGYRLGRFDLAVGARNLLDTYPDQPSSSVDVDGSGTPARDFNNNFGTFPWAAASPFGFNGRFVYVRVRAELTR